MGSAYGRGPATHGAALAAAPWQRSPGSRFVRLRSHRSRSPNGFVRWLSVVAIAPPWSSGGASRAGSPSAVVRRSPSIASSWRRLNRRSPAWARVAWPTGSLPAGNRDAHVGALRALGLSLAGHVALGQFGPSTPASPIVRLRYEIRTRARRSVLETDGSNHHACHRRNICAIAEQNNMAIAAFNTSSLEAVRVAIDAAEATGDPVPPPSPWSRPW